MCFVHSGNYLSAFLEKHDVKLITKLPKSGRERLVCFSALYKKDSDLIFSLKKRFSFKKPNMG